MERTTTKPADLIESMSDDFRHAVGRLHAAISGAMAGHPAIVWTGKFWGGSYQNIIGYGDYSYKRSGSKNVEWFIVGLAAQKNYISVYVNAVEDGQYLTETYADRLGKAKVGKSSISFRSIDDIDLDVLLDLVKAARIQISGR